MSSSAMELSEEALRAGREKVQWVLENQCRIPVRATIPISFYYKTSNNLVDEADHYYRSDRLEQSFILYSRYIMLFVEELKLHHPNFPNVPVQDREAVKEIIRTKAFPRAEELKVKLQRKYAVEYELAEKAKVGEDDAKTPTAALNKLPPNIHNENEATLQQIKASYGDFQPATMVLPVLPPTNSALIHSAKEPMKPTFDRARKPANAYAVNGSGMGSFRRVIIPNDITPKFLQVAQKNTDHRIETCGILAGTKNDKDQYVITHVVVPKQNGGPDSCDTEKEEEMVEYISNNNLITLGWIHTHPTQTAFLSSVDLHTHLPYQMLMPEAIAIVISPKFNDTGVFSLTPDTGIPVISTCKKSGFHEHINNPPLFLPSSHTIYNPALLCEIVDLRN